MSPELVDEGEHIWVLFAGASLLLHVLFIIAMIVLPQIARPTTPNLPYINITLETMPTLKPGTPGPKIEQPQQKEVPPAPKKETPPEPVIEPPKPEPVVEKPPEPEKPVVKVESTKKKTTPRQPKEAEISTAPKSTEPPKLTSLKKKTYKADVAKDKAIREMRERVEKGRPSPVEEALERFRKDPGQRPQQESGSGGRALLDKMEILKNQHVIDVGEHIKQNWAIPDRFANGVLEADIVITVHSDGNITDIWFEKRSGDSFFDESAERAVRKSIPTLPFPKGLDKTPFSFIVGFSPEDM